MFLFVKLYVQFDFNSHQIIITRNLVYYVEVYNTSLKI